MIQQIRQATTADLDRLMEIFEAARRFMQATGNAHQWVGGYPQRELIAREIANGHCYACQDETGRVAATFCLVPGPDPTYRRIDDGAWPSDGPYHVIHRLASDGTCRGVGALCLSWCARRYPCLRADTHADNRIMQALLDRMGFVRCGIIYVANGSPRIAYQRG